MFNEYGPVIKTTISFLKQLGIKANNYTVNETLQNHPDWPSILCISDSLLKWNIPNAAGKVAPTQIDELPTPFIAYTYSSELPLAVVTNVTETSVASYSKNYHQPVIESRENFLKNWTGVYLLAEPTARSGL